MTPAATSRGPTIATLGFGPDQLPDFAIVGYHRTHRELTWEVGMDAYTADVEVLMKRMANWLSEKDRRRYAAVEAAKLGHGGVEYVSQLLDLDPKTIRQGLHDLEHTEDPAAGRVRKKGWTPNPERIPPHLRRQPLHPPARVHRRRPHA